MTKIIPSGDDSGLLRDLYGLRAAAGVELREDPGRVGLHRIFADEELLRDFPVTQTLGDELEDLQLARRHAQAFNIDGIQYERTALANHDSLAGTSQFESQPNPEPREDQS